MNRFFVDTFYWIALTNRRDQLSARPAFNRTLTTPPFLYHRGECWENFWILRWWGTRDTSRRAVLFTRRVLTDPHITVVPQTHASFSDGLALYESRPDKEYSLTDCISMQTMRLKG